MRGRKGEREKGKVGKGRRNEKYNFSKMLSIATLRQTRQRVPHLGW